MQAGRRERRRTRSPGVMKRTPRSWSMSRAKPVATPSAIETSTPFRVCASAHAGQCVRCVHGAARCGNRRGATAVSGGSRGGADLERGGQKEQVRVMEESDRDERCGIEWVPRGAHPANLAAQRLVVEEALRHDAVAARPALELGPKANQRARRHLQALACSLPKQPPTRRRRPEGATSGGIAALASLGSERTGKCGTVGSGAAGRRAGGWAGRPCTLYASCSAPASRRPC